MKYIFFLLLSLTLLTEACRPPRCNIPNCYVRLKHRHGGENWKAAELPADINADAGNGADPNANRGKLYRGVPWWQKNKNPKIGEGYKPGYKYDYRKPKYKKPKQRKSRDGEVPVTEGEEQPIANEQQEGAETNPEQPAAEEKKGLFKGLRSKKSKKTEPEQPVEQEEKQVPQQEQQPKKPAPAEKKDGF